MDKKDFNRKYYNPNISNQELADEINALNEEEKLGVVIDLVNNKPWDKTTKTTLLVIIPVVAFSLLLSLLLILVGLSVVLFSLVYYGFGGSIFNLSIWMKLAIIAIPLLLSIISSIGGMFLFYTSGIIGLFISITGFAYTLPLIYGRVSGNKIERPNTIRINNSFYEVSSNGDRINVIKTSSPGFGAHALNAFSALFYQFKQKSVYKKELELANNDKNVRKQYLKINVLAVLDNRRSKLTTSFLKINYILSIILAILIALLTIFETILSINNTLLPIIFFIL